MKTMMTLAGAAFVLALGANAHAADDEHPSVKRQFDLPPSADLAYTISARQRGLALNGDATLTWRAGDGKYAVSAESRVAVLGKLTENRSSGAIDAYGLAPNEFYDKRFRKEAVTATFDRGAKTISFSDGDKTYPIRGGEQDRVSISWQLVGVARAAKDKFKAGSEWQFFVVGPRDADPWTFRVVGREKVQLGGTLGEVDAVHVARATPPGSREQTLDMWLAPSLEWYPVKLRFTEGERETVEQTLERIGKK
ncbi:DUF3108 domain-containing protein [uncultured Massilia sp.]|uniref:DUF3108 domain-containing protein n=1 Tax=uncultured Massilia sp. TaxID=169973 RepID=UPI0025E21BB7|nr:DUF3108 domain-containing protein [uncultured Massilia sp.]